jgi:hypothetical protein
MPFASGFFQQVTTSESITTTRSGITLDNYLAYRSAVITYTEQNPAFTGVVQDNTLVNLLPPGYIKLEQWTNQISATDIVIYGSQNIGTISASSDTAVYLDNYIVGYAKNGNWVINGVCAPTPAGLCVAAPAYVPDGAILSLLNK